jgi:hypothetical protein
MIRMNPQDIKNAEKRINKSGKMKFGILKVSTSVSIFQKNTTSFMRSFTSIHLITLIVITIEEEEAVEVVIVAIEAAEGGVEVMVDTIMKVFKMRILGKHHHRLNRLVKN